MYVCVYVQFMEFLVIDAGHKMPLDLMCILNAPDVPNIS